MLSHAAAVGAPREPLRAVRGSGQERRTGGSGRADDATGRADRVAIALTSQLSLDLSPARLLMSQPRP